MNTEAISCSLVASILNRVFREVRLDFLDSNFPGAGRPSAPATRLTQRRRRVVHGGPPLPAVEPATRPPTICSVCGTPIPSGRTYCVLCAVGVSTEHLGQIRHSGWRVSQGSKAQTRRSKTQRRHAAALRGWIASNQPAWLDNEAYTQKIQPRLVLSIVSQRMIARRASA